MPLALKAARRLSEDTEVLDLYKQHIEPLDYEMLSNRDKYIAKQDYTDEMFRFAKQFSEADNIVIAAPYWDLSFPSILKCYIESICVNGLTFKYDEAGIPAGLCRAERLIYVTTAGGYIPENDHGYKYIRQLCTDLFGIKDTECIKAEGLDIAGNDIGKALREAERAIDMLPLLKVKNAAADDLEHIMSIYKNAQDFMARSGNPGQWGHTYPDRETIEADIKEGRCRLMYDGTGVHGAFALCEGTDPTYLRIDDGSWLNDEPYVTIHRIAGDGKAHGIFRCAAGFCKGISKNVRIDTHEKNAPMQRVIEENGFRRCGIIYTRDLTPRIAYQWTGEEM